MKLPFPSRHLPLAVLAAALAASFGTGALAADSPDNAPSFSVLGSFTGADGTLPGMRPFAAPIWSSEDGKLLGTTRSSGLGFGFEYEPGVFQYTRGNFYQYSLDGTLASRILPAAIGWGSTPPVLRSNGDIVGAAMYGETSTGASANGNTFSMRGGAAVRIGDGPRARGQLGNAPFGTLYTTNGLGTSCANGVGASLYQIPLDGEAAILADFCNFATTDNRRRLLFHKGAAPVINVWSVADNALYSMSYIGSNATYEGVPSGDNAGGALVRIDGEALKAGKLEADDIELLHFFARNAEGTVTAGDVLAVSMVEDGEWLYGTLTGGNNALGAVWRVKKSDPGTFHLVQRFDVDLSAASDNANGTPTNPAGQLVRATDGNIYGTSQRDASAIQPTGSTGKFSAVGAGTIWRIKTGSAANRSDDSFEVLHRFSSTDGAMPIGLTAGPVVDGKQLIFGATEYGGSAGDTCYSNSGTAVSTTCTGNGTVFQLAIPLPSVSIDSFTADNGTALSATVGARPTLAWNTTGASACAAGGDWSGTKQGSGSEQIGPLAAGNYRYTLDCSNDLGIQSDDSVVTIAVTPASDGNDSEGSDPGSGNDGSSGGGPLAPATLLLASLALLRRRSRHVE